MNKTRGFTNSNFLMPLNKFCFRSVYIPTYEWQSGWSRGSYSDRLHPRGPSDWDMANLQGLDYPGLYIILTCFKNLRGVVGLATSIDLNLGYGKLSTWYRYASLLHTMCRVDWGKAKEHWNVRLWKKQTDSVSDVVIFFWKSFLITIYIFTHIFVLIVYFIALLYYSIQFELPSI